jgi:hypothetical protein
MKNQPLWAIFEKILKLWLEPRITSNSFWRHGSLLDHYSHVVVRHALWPPLWEAWSRLLRPL